MGDELPERMKGREGVRDKTTGLFCDIISVIVKTITTMFS